MHRPGGAWSAPQALSPADRTGQGAQAAVDATGNVTVAWDERYAGNSTATTSDDLSCVKVATRAASNAIVGAPVSTTPEDTRSTGAPRIAVGPDGTAVVGFQFNGSAVPTEFHAWAATRDGADGAWGAPQQLVSDAAASSSVRAVGVAPDGTAYVGYWLQGVSSGDSQAGLERRPRGGTWTAEQGVGPKNTDIGDGAIAFLANDALFAYEGTIGAATKITQAVRWRSVTASAEGSRDLLAPGTTVSVAGLNTDNQGGAVLVVDRSDIGTSGRSQAIAFDASPPRLVSLSIPAAATTAAPVAMSASFADLWSAVAGVTWDFGDGASGSGVSVSHAYAAAGTYAVTVHGADTLGNTRTATAPITVTTPAPVVPAPDTTRPVLTLSSPTCSKRLSRAACKRRRASRTQWRTLRGTASDKGGSGVARVEVAVARKSGKRLLVLKGKSFRKGTTKSFAAATKRATLKGSAWALRLPSLVRGTYLLRIRAIDNAGNASALLQRTLKLR